MGAHYRTEVVIVVNDSDDNYGMGGDTGAEEAKAIEAKRDADMADAAEEMKKQQEDERIRAIEESRAIEAQRDADMAEGARAWEERQRREELKGIASIDKAGRKRYIDKLQKKEKRHEQELSILSQPDNLRTASATNIAFHTATGSLDRTQRDIAAAKAGLVNFNREETKKQKAKDKEYVSGSGSGHNFSGTIDLGAMHNTPKSGAAADTRAKSESEINENIAAFQRQKGYQPVVASFEAADSGHEKVKESKKIVKNEKNQFGGLQGSTLLPYMASSPEELSVKTKTLVTDEEGKPKLDSRGKRQYEMVDTKTTMPTSVSNLIDPSGMELSSSEINNILSFTKSPSPKMGEKPQLITALSNAFSTVAPMGIGVNKEVHSHQDVWIDHRANTEPVINATGHKAKGLGGGILQGEFGVMGFGNEERRVHEKNVASGKSKTVTQYMFEDIRRDTVGSRQRRSYDPNLSYVGIGSGASVITDPYFSSGHFQERLAKTKNLRGGGLVFPKLSEGGMPGSFRKGVENVLGSGVPFASDTKPSGSGKPSGGRPISNKEKYKSPIEMHFKRPLAEISEKERGDYYLESLVSSKYGSTPLLRQRSVKKEGEGVDAAFEPITKAFLAKQQEEKRTKVHIAEVMSSMSGLESRKLGSLMRKRTYRALKNPAKYNPSAYIYPEAGYPVRTVGIPYKVAAESFTKNAKERHALEKSGEDYFQSFAGVSNPLEEQRSNELMTVGSQPHVGQKFFDSFASAENLPRKSPTPVEYGFAEMFKAEEDMAGGANANTAAKVAYLKNSTTGRLMWDKITGKENPHFPKAKEVKPIDTSFWGEMKRRNIDAAKEAAAQPFKDLLAGREARRKLLEERSARGFMYGGGLQPTQAGTFPRKRGVPRKQRNPISHSELAFWGRPFGIAKRLPRNRKGRISKATRAKARRMALRAKSGKKSFFSSMFG